MRYSRFSFEVPKKESKQFLIPRHTGFKQKNEMVVMAYLKLQTGLVIVFS